MRYRITDQETNADDFGWSADVGDVISARRWTFTPQCDAGPCDVDAISFNLDIEDAAEVTSTWSYAPPTPYRLDDGPYELGACTVADGALFEPAYSVTYELVLTPTDYAVGDGSWVVIGLTGERHATGVPTDAAAAAGCTATWSESYEIEATPLEPGAEPAFGPQGSEAMEGWILFSSGGVQAIQEDGGGLHEVISAIDPVWSPDFTRVAYYAGGGIAVVNADGTDDMLIAGGGESPSWSPDGRRIAFVRKDPGARSGDTYVVNVATGSVTNVTSGMWASRAVWLDNARLAVGQPFTDAPPRGDTYWVVDVDDSAAEYELLLEDVSDLAVSPDGTQIAATIDNTLVVTDGEGARRNTIARGESNENFFRVTWSPDGGRILWASFLQGGGIVLNIVDSDGANRSVPFDIEEIVPGLGTISGLSWAGT